MTVRTFYTHSDLLLTMFLSFLSTEALPTTQYQLELLQLKVTRAIVVPYLK